MTAGGTRNRYAGIWATIQRQKKNNEEERIPAYHNRSQICSDRPGCFGLRCRPNWSWDRRRASMWQLRDSPQWAGAGPPGGHGSATSSINAPSPRLKAGECWSHQPPAEHCPLDRHRDGLRSGSRVKRSANCGDLYSRARNGVVADSGPALEMRSANPHGSRPVLPGCLCFRRPLARCVLVAIFLWRNQWTGGTEAFDNPSKVAS